MQQCTGFKVHQLGYGKMCNAPGKNMTFKKQALATDYMKKKKWFSAG